MENALVEQNNSNQLSFDFADIQNKFNRSITTTDEVRTSIYAPVSKVSANSALYKNFVNNGRRREIECNFSDISGIEISGELLTQTHKDIVDAILATNDKILVNNEGDFVAHISMYKVLKYISNSTNNYKWLDDKISEIKRSVITLKPKNGNKKDRIEFNIFDTLYYDDDKKMYGVILNKRFVKWFIGTLTMDYRKHLKDIAVLSGKGNGFIKAVIRFFISQDMNSRNGKAYVISLDTLLEKVDQPRENDRQRKSAVGYINAFKVDLEKYCIEYDKKTKTFFYHGADNLYFTGPLKALQ